MRSLLITAMMFAFANMAHAADARCSAILSRGRAQVRVDLTNFLNADLSRLIRLGLRGQISVNVTLMRARRMWFDSELEQQSRTFPLVYLRRRGFFLSGRPVDDQRRLSLKTISVGRQAGNDNLYVIVTVDLRVVTAASLNRAANWITDSKSDSGAIKDRLIKMVVSDLTRHATTECSVQASHR